MDGKFPYLLGLVMVVLGALLIYGNQTFSSRHVVILAGLLFIIAGLIDSITTIIKIKAINAAQEAKAINEGADVSANTKIPVKASKHILLNQVVSSAALLLGVILIAMPLTFAPYIHIVFGLFVLFGAIAMFYSLAIGVRPLILPAWLYAFPVVLLIASVIVYFQNTPESDSFMMIITGLAACAFGVGSILTNIFAVKAGKSLAVSTDNQESSTTEIKSLDD